MTKLGDFLKGYSVPRGQFSGDHSAAKSESDKGGFPRGRLFFLFAVSLSFLGITGNKTLDPEDTSELEQCLLKLSHLQAYATDIGAMASDYTLSHEERLRKVSASVSDALSGIAHFDGLEVGDDVPESVLSRCRDFESEISAVFSSYLRNNSGNEDIVTSISQMREIGDQRLAISDFLKEAADYVEGYKPPSL